MTFANTLERIGRLSDDPTVLEDLAREALAEGEEERALALIAPTAERHGDARLLQWTGLLHRALDQHSDALTVFDRAANLAPSDPGIAHGRARVALEAGLPAVALFDAARRLAPDSGEVILGRAAALFAEGRGRAAIDDLAVILAQNPTWIAGHTTLAQLRALIEGRDGAMTSFRDALEALPDNTSLWQAAIETHVRGERFADALDHVNRARAQIGDDPYFDLYEALTLSEQGQCAAADPLFARISDIDMPVVTLWYVRHLIRTNRLGIAARFIESRIDAADPALWPYASIIWRMTGDPRFGWLEGDDRLVSVIDLADTLPDFDRFAEVLRSLHLARGEHLDQSVRGGTQTDGPLFSRIEPEMRALRATVMKAIKRHIAQLPPPDPDHPVLAKRRDRKPRFAGSWSVRLGGQGHHANHVHPQGWFSSALYVSLPDDNERGSGEAGWLTLGQPQAALGLNLPPVRTVEPKPGRLVLFPSTMWHGTIPFAAGERLTVAFDVAPPR